MDGRFRFVDGVDLELITPGGKKFIHKIRDCLKFGSTSMYQNPVDAALSIQKQLSAGGHEVPDVLTVLDQEQGFELVLKENGLFCSRFYRSKRILEQRGTVAKAGKPKAWRQATTRRALGNPLLQCTS